MRTSLAVMPPAQPVSRHALLRPRRNRDALVQDSDFLFLTGISQQAVAVLEASGSGASGRLTLFIPDSTPQVGSPSRAKSPSHVLRRPHANTEALLLRATMSVTHRDAPQTSLIWRCRMRPGTARS